MCHLLREDDKTPRVLQNLANIAVQVVMLPLTVHPITLLLIKCKTVGPNVASYTSTKTFLKTYNAAVGTYMVQRWWLKIHLT